MEVSKNEREKKEKGGDTTTRSVEEGEGALWSKRTVSKRNSNEYGRMDDAVGNSNPYRV